MRLNKLNRDMCLNHFVLIEVCSVEMLVACVRSSAGFKGGSFRDASMRALWSDRENCSHNASQKFTILFEIITFLIRKPFFYVTVMENNSTDNFFM